MKRSIVALIVIVFVYAGTAWADFDISPFFENGKLVTGGLSHEGDRISPSKTIFGYDFGEDPYDPFNPSDPGVNQTAGVGNLPVGDPIRYNILSSLLYWDGNGPVNFVAPPEQTYMTLLVGSSLKTLTGTSGPQTGSLIQTIGDGGFVHKHFTTSLYAAPGAGNIPDIGDLTYIEPTTGIYAFSMELTLTVSGKTYVSDPLWIVWNNGMSEEVHDAAMAAVPEPASIVLLLAGGLAVFRRRYRSLNK